MKLGRLPPDAEGRQMAKVRLYRVRVEQRVYNDGLS